MVGNSNLSVSGLWTHEDLSSDPQKPIEMIGGCGSLLVIHALEDRKQIQDPQGKLASKISLNH